MKEESRFVLQQTFWLFHQECIIIRCSSSAIWQLRLWLRLAPILAMSHPLLFLISHHSTPLTIIRALLFRAILPRWFGGQSPTVRLSLSSRSVPSNAQRLQPSVLRLMTMPVLISLLLVSQMTWLAAELSNLQPERFSQRAYEGTRFISQAWLSTEISDLKQICMLKRSRFLPGLNRAFYAL